jgi:hypothetical protein
MLAVSMVTGPVVVHVRGTGVTVGGLVLGFVIVSVRLSGAPVVNVGSPMLTVPEAPAVTVPDNVPGTDT